MTGLLSESWILLDAVLDVRVERFSERLAVAAPSMLGAIYGQGDDIWSGPDYFADELPIEDARSYAAERGIDLYAEPSRPESFWSRLKTRFSGSRS